MQCDDQTPAARQELKIDAHNAGRRFDNVVRQACPDIGLGTLMKWMRCGRIRINGKKRSPSTRLNDGDVLLLPTADAPEHGITRPKRPTLPALDIIFECPDLLIVNKPAELACHPGTLHQNDTLTARVVQHLGAHAAPPGKRPGLAQRLDKGVSGLVPIGKNALVLKAMSNEAAAHSLDKRYVALVDGRVKKAKGSIDLALRVDDEPMGDRPRTHPDPMGKPAVTHYEVVRRFTTATLVALRLETGRTHQIRAHMRALGHPLLGDPRYGHTAINQRLYGTYGVQRPLLHADQLFLKHPVSGINMHLVAPYPPDLQRILAALRAL